MNSPSRPDEFESPKRSLSGRIAGAIERFCTTGARFSLPLFLLVGVLFAVYLLGGYALLSIGIWSPSYEFLSLTEDVYFAWIAFLTGGVICFSTGSLIGLAFLTEGEDGIHNEVSILASFIGFGFGAGTMRMTYATVLASIL